MPLERITRWTQIDFEEPGYFKICELRKNKCNVRHYLHWVIVRRRIKKSPGKVEKFKRDRSVIVFIPILVISWIQV